MGIDVNDFCKYVVCPRCHSIYNLEACVNVLRDNRKESAKCQHVPYPNHPSSSRCSKCNKTVKCKTDPFKFIAAEV